MTEYSTDTDSDSDSDPDFDFDLDATDELPVLSEETIMRAEAEAAAAVDRERGSSPAPLLLDRPKGQDELADSIEDLRDLLDRTETRWDLVEARLRAQDEAIAGLRRAVEHRAAEAAVATPEYAVTADESPEQHERGDRAERAETGEPADRGAPGEPGAWNEAAGPDEADAAREPITAEAPANDDADREPAASPAPAAPSDNDSAADGVERRLLERIDGLESYIAGRADRWKAMEDELNRKAARISELEKELTHRIAREEKLVDQLHTEGGRSDQLRDKLRHMNRQLEAGRLERARPELDITHNLSVAPMPGSATTRPQEQDRGEAPNGPTPRLRCLSSDRNETYTIAKGTVRIGRGRHCDIRINKDFVSREHAIIRYDLANVTIEDRGSTNGVFVGDQRVQHKRLTDGDEVRIGETRFRFSQGSDA